MSADEDTELRDLVAQSLESNGVLGKIKAQLRASVFLALEEQESIHNKTPMQNPELRKFLGTKEGRNVASLVREFLEYFKLDFSVAVFEPESCVTSDIYSGRSSLARDMGITEVDSQPLLSSFVKRGAPEKVGRGTENSAVHLPKDLTPKQIAAARKKFEHYDADKNGTIEKDELRNLFCDIFPGFHKNMIDRYVNDEFRAADTDLSNAIDFDEFLGMYKRLFVQCRSVVATEESSSPRRPKSPSRIPSPTNKPFEEAEVEASFSFSSSVESKNKKNEHPDSRTGSKSPTEKRKNTLENGQKQDDDSFFDDPIPSYSEKSFSGDKSKDKKDTKTSSLPKSGGFLSGAPSLNSAGSKSSKDVEFDKDFKNIDKNLADLGFDIPEDDYDDDFDSSNVSPIGPTPRSARSDQNVKSIEEEIEEDLIEEDLSIASDLLRSENSAADDLTTDRTVSPTEQSTVFDYAEEVHLP